MTKAYLILHPHLSYHTNQKLTHIQSQLQNFNHPIQPSKIQLTKITNNPQPQLAPHKPPIFHPHLLLLHHPQLIQPIQHKITNHKLNPATPLHQVTTQFISIFHSI
ncbi:phosphoenolpyruvate-utilizing N-terminal domain-containing protein, partial [Staphylococcus epidermidis]|uniref:phosphoenolpyruvate-utilizing N-terminal domain-containing protein n=1 Tax=Staphylococcus epidermidis TaxID=1282 RepID=UPI0037DA2928